MIPYAGKNKGGKPLSPERARVGDARIMAEWAKGYSALEISRDLGLTEGTVHGVLLRSSGPDAEKARIDHFQNRKGKHASRKHKDPAREATVLAKWADGKSATDIGMDLGISRNVVIGIVHRSPPIDRVKRVQPSALVVRTASHSFAAVNAQRAAERRLASPGLRAASEPPPISCRPVKLADLEPHHCRWPLGDPFSPDFRFCGDSKMPSGGPYCGPHAKLGLRHMARDAQREAEMER